MEKVIVSDTLNMLFTGEIDRAWFISTITYKLAYMGGIHKAIVSEIEKFPANNIGLYQAYNRAAGLALFAEITAKYQHFLCRFIYGQLPTAFGAYAMALDESALEVMFICSIENIIKYANEDAQLLANNIEFAAEFNNINPEVANNLYLNMDKQPGDKGGLTLAELSEFVATCNNINAIYAMRKIFEKNKLIHDVLC
jgi:hypothetical protein